MKARNAATLLVAFFILVMPAVVPAQTPVPKHVRFIGDTRAPRPQPEGVPGGDPEEAEGDVEQRLEWFRKQREYPNRSIPPDARRRALESFRGQKLGRSPATTWKSIGPVGTDSAFPSNWGVTSGRINAIAVSPADPNIVLVGGSTGGIWRSVDAGETFVPTSDEQVDLAVGSIAFAASDPSIVYAGMGDIALFYLGTGVLKSTDAGQSWTRVSNGSLPPVGLVATIAVDPGNPNRLYVAQYAALQGEEIQSSGFYRSNDGGVNWTRTLSGLPRDVVIDPANSQVLLQGTVRVDENDLPAGVYKSSDGGNTWSKSFQSPYDYTSDVRLAVSPSAPGSAYLLIGGFLNNVFDMRVYATTNSGGTWTRKIVMDVDDAQFGYNSLIAADPSNFNTVFIGTRDFYRSTDGGNAWSPLTNNFDANTGGYHPARSTSHPDQHAIAFDPAHSMTVYIGNDGGISKSVNGGSSFFSLNASLSLTQFTSLAVHPTDPAISYGGTQDNGTQRRLEESNWDEFISGDGGQCVIDPLDPSIVFTTYVFTTIFRFSSNGNAFDDSIGGDSAFGEPSGAARVAFYPPFVGNGVDSRLYFGTWRLFVSTDRGASWTAPGGTQDLTNGNRNVLSAIGVSRSDPNVIFTGANDGRVMATTNGGVNWHQVTTGLPDRFVTDIEVSPADSTKVFATFSGFGTGHVFTTNNGGQTWADISRNLPDIPVNTVLIDPIDPDILYVGTDIGIFTRRAGSNDWVSFNDGLPPVVVMSLVAQPTGLIQAATYGRGAYQFGFGGAPPTVLLTAPNSGKLKAGTTTAITWTSTPGDAPIASHTIRMSTDGGLTFPTAIVEGLGASDQSYDYAIPVDTPKTKKARFLVVAIDIRGNQGQDGSDGNIKIKRARN